MLRVEVSAGGGEIDRLACEYLGRRCRGNAGHRCRAVTAEIKYDPRRYSNAVPFSRVSTREHVTVAGVDVIHLGQADRESGCDREIHTAPATGSETPLRPVTAVGRDVGRS